MLMMTPLSPPSFLGLRIISFARSRTRLKFPVTFLFMMSLKDSMEWGVRSFPKIYGTRRLVGVPPRQKRLAPH